MGKGDILIKREIIEILENTLSEIKQKIKLIKKTS